MGLEKVAKEIIIEAEKKVSEIIEEGKKESSQILNEAKKKAVQLQKNIEEETQKIVEETRQLELSSHELFLNKRILEAKKQLLDELFSKVKQKIMDLDKKQRTEIVTALCKKGLFELPSAKFVYSNEEDKKTVSNVKGLSFKGTIDCLGGVILENNDGSIRTNHTFEEIIEKAKEENLNEVSSRIFSKK